MNYRIYGNPNKIILHGGPGAIGSIGDLAKELNDCVEILNRGQSIHDQLEEIRAVVEEFKMRAPIIIGHSWGAWLAYIYASKYPTAKIFLISCGCFDEKYLPLMNKKRNQSLTEDEQIEVSEFFKGLAAGEELNMDRFGYLMTKMDSYDLRTYEEMGLGFDAEGHDQLMAEIRPLRKEGSLLEMGKSIKGEIILIHGSDDPHPFEGVTEPFDREGIKYDSYLLDKCGHNPWRESHAYQRFYEVMRKELTYVMKTERLVLRHFHKADKKFFRLMNADSDVMTYFPNTLDADASDAFLDRIIENYTNDQLGLLAVELKDSQEVIGFIGLASPRFEMHFTPCVEIGWRLYKDYWHFGYALEGAKAVLDFALNIMSYKEIVSFTSEINMPSITLMKRIGLTYQESFDHPLVEGPLKRHVLYKIRQ